MDPLGDERITLPFSNLATGECHFLSAPATINPFGASPSFVFNPLAWEYSR
jgi:hypothetical protein